MSESPAAVVRDEGTWWRFADPVRIVSAAQPAQVAAALNAVETAVERDDLFAAGFLSYEAGAAYGLATHHPAPDAPPLIWFGLFRSREAVEAPEPADGYAFGPWQPSIDRETYLAAAGAIRAQIAAGNTYQANFTFLLRAAFSGDPWALFATLSAAQAAPYAAYIDTGRHVICSASPELFFRLDGEAIFSRPMKGTAARGLSAAEDEGQVDWLRASEKNRAENVMIVDMIRNDLGRVAQTGSVHVPELFAVERYPTVLQMTSTVAARTSAALSDILAALFPCASITGAPKVRTMRILRDLEAGPRGVYTGAAGFLAPGRRARFNVSIRTAVIDRDRRTATYGVGSGVVWDSDPAGEYDECLLKARVLAVRPAEVAHFSLLESLRWTPEDGYYLPERHVDRLAASAAYFGVACDAAAIRARLEAVAGGLTESSKVRLLLRPDGRIEVEAEPLSRGARPEPVRVGLAAGPVRSDDRFLYHKTTRRDIYEAARASRPDCDDAILWNERGELTEATASNIVLRLDGALVTPPVSSGLLPGTFREELLARGEIVERVLTGADLARAEALWLVNSVRCWQAASWAGS